MAERLEPVNGNGLVTSHSTLEYLQPYLSQNGNGSNPQPAIEKLSGGIRPITFDTTGLLNPAVLIEYMKECRCDELDSPRDPTTHELEFHHLYFPRPMYDTWHTPAVYKNLHRLRYNQVMML